MKKPDLLAFTRRTSQSKPLWEGIRCNWATLHVKARLNSWCQTVKGCPGSIQCLGEEGWAVANSPACPQRPKRCVQSLPVSQTHRHPACTPHCPAGPCLLCSTKPHKPGISTFSPLLATLTLVLRQNCRSLQLRLLQVSLKLASCIIIEHFLPSQSTASHKCAPLFKDWQLSAPA